LVDTPLLGAEGSPEQEQELALDMIYSVGRYTTARDFVCDIIYSARILSRASLFASSGGGDYLCVGDREIALAIYKTMDDSLGTFSFKSYYNLS
jgi:hypothetical protein